MNSTTSKSRSNAIGSTSVIPMQKATRLPAPDPLPGPTGISLRLAYPTKSLTIKK